MKNFIKIIGLVSVAAIVVLIGVFGTKQTSGNTSIAVSSTGRESHVAGGTAKGVVLTPTTQTTNISCSLNASIVRNGDGTVQANLTWNITPGAVATIDGAGITIDSTQSSGSALSPVITKTTTFTIMVSDQFATSTCSTTATP